MTDAATNSDISLDALRAGDRHALTLMVETYSPLMYRLLLRMLRNESDAEDVLQETFVKALRGLSEFEGRSSLSTWLYRIATNEALMLLRKRHPEVVSIDDHTDGEDETPEPMQIVDWCCLPESELEGNESRAMISKAIDQLPEGLRVVFLLRDVEGLSIRDTSLALNISEQNVKTRLLRARLRMRELLSAYYAEKVKVSDHE